MRLLQSDIIVAFLLLAVGLAVTAYRMLCKKGRALREPARLEDRDDVTYPIPVSPAVVMPPRTYTSPRPLRPDEDTRAIYVKAHRDAT